MYQNHEKYTLTEERPNFGRSIFRIYATFQIKVFYIKLQKIANNNTI